MKNRLTPPFVRSLNLSTINDLVIDIYRNLNRIADSADEVSFRHSHDGTRELILREGRGELVDVSNTVKFSSDSSSIKSIVQGKLKEDLSLDKVTNESKATMFTNPSFTGENKYNNSADNIHKFYTSDADENTLVDIVTALKSPIIRFMSGADPRWKIGFDTDDTINKFKIDNGAGTTLADPSEFELDNSGNLVLVGTSTSSAGVCSGTTAASASASGIVELATTAETTSGTDTVRAVTPDGLQDGYQGSGNIVTTGTLDSGAISSGFGIINTGSSSITTTGNASFGAITAGAVIWESFPFVVTNGVAGRPYYRDVDDLFGDFRKWDDYDTSPTSISRGDVGGQFVVPEDCTLKGMQAVITNTTSAQNIDIHIFTGTPNLDSGSGTTLALAGGAVTTVSISTASYNYSSTASFDVDLTAGDIVVPMVEHDSGVGNQTFRGNITLKFITR